MSLSAWAYLILMIVGLVVLCFSYWKIRSFRIFILYFTVTGVTLLFDYFIYLWANSYVYKLNVLHNELDSHLGAMVNGLVLPSFAVLFVVMRCRWYWSIPLAIFFTLIELIFTKWGIFETNWWKPGYTTIGLMIYFPVARLWWNHLKKKWIHFGSLLLSFYGIFIPIHFLHHAVFKMRTYHVAWIEQLQSGSSAFTTITGLIFAIVLAYLSIVNARSRWFLFIIVCYIAYEIVLKYIGIVQAEHSVLDSIGSFLTFYLGYLFVRYADRTIKVLVNKT
ncbi:hypothetical protein RGU12_07035 [Fredinandcohnia sp. QZ13]|uniref:hypothetical protein n=1 Tax=Fredinandcohnia sp. QZ13 TaxID=3073144 RepID=UPI00285349FA|nr:hypothetical protein [Fredinandcohnia sp. QZ13]MDR4887312.1 hypothetical protein [Fredinandcohnia sp. QZ13]